jgi:hypothetical protein
VLLVQFGAEFHFLQDGTTTTLYDALTHLPWPYFVFHLWYRANYYWSQLFNLSLSSYASSSISATIATRGIAGTGAGRRAGRGGGTGRGACAVGGISGGASADNEYYKS